jgi:hypothetical protein
MKLRRLYVVLLSASLGLPVIGITQPPPPPPPVDTQSPTPIPFDGGLTLLLAAGAGYAIKKGREKRNNRKKPVV